MSADLTTSEAPASLESSKERGPEPAEEGDQAGPKEVWLGATVRDLSPALRQSFSIPESEKGVVITEIDPGSKAEEIELAAGDLIRAVNQESVPDLKGFREAAKKVVTKSGVVFDLLRRGEPLYISYMGSEK